MSKETSCFATYKMGKMRQILKIELIIFTMTLLILKVLIKLLKKHKKSYKDIGIYNIRYITIKKIDDCKNIYSVNPLY